jgi:putative transposase
MPRTARVVVPEVSLHVVQRGHDRRDCFFEDDDYLAYLGYLREFSLRFGCSVHAYCLMTNHVHLFVTPHAHEACALMMKYTAQYYVNRINKRLKRSGTLWEGRFYSCLVPLEHYALACYRYIELNPVEARMVRHPAEYRWSSYAINVRATGASFLRAHPAYEALGDDAAQRASAYVGLFDMPVQPTMIDEIRKATRGGYPLGVQRKSRGRPPSDRKIGTVPI